MAGAIPEFSRIMVRNVLTHESAMIELDTRTNNGGAIRTRVLDALREVGKEDWGLNEHARIVLRARDIMHLGEADLRVELAFLREDGILMFLNRGRVEEREAAREVRPAEAE